MPMVFTRSGKESGREDMTAGRSITWRHGKGGLRNGGTPGETFI